MVIYFKWERIAYFIFYEFRRFRGHDPHVVFMTRVAAVPAWERCCDFVMVYGQVEN